jgi:hypothetical protein
MTQYLFSTRVRAAIVSGAFFLLAAVSAAPAMAASPPMPAGSGGDTSTCTDPVLSQPFLWAKDSNWYTLVPGESANAFDGSGWTLGGGAQVLNTQLQDGTAGTVLDLPSGAYAVSPTICVSSDYPTARTFVRNVAGAEGIQFYVSYAGTNTWTNPKNTGQFHGQQTNWSLSDPINLQPPNASGWQMVRFGFVAGGKTSDFQLYDFNVDPRMKH